MSFWESIRFKFSKRFHLPRRQAIVITLFYAIAIVIVTWPTANLLTTHMPGNSTDTLLHYWNGWSVKTALSKGQSPFYTDLLFYPRGVSLVTHNMAWMNILPWIILAPLTGGILAYNLILLASLLLCGWASYFLAYRLTKNRYASFLAGLIYLAWPFRISQLDHPNLLATYWVPLFMLGLINILERGRWKDAILTGIALALVGYTRWQVLIPVSAMAFTYTVMRAPDWWPRRHGLRVIRHLALAAFIGTILLMPPIILLLEDQLGSPTAANVINDDDEYIMQTDLLAYVTPPGWNQLFSSWSQTAYDRYYPDRSFDRRYPAYLGLVALVFTGMSLRFHWKESRSWLCVGLVLIGLAAGPVLRINGTLYENAPTLYRLLMGLEFVRLIRVPDRFNMLLALPISIMFAYGLAAWLARRPLGRLRSRKNAILMTGALALLVVVEYQIIPIKRHDVSYDKTFYAKMAAESGEFAVLNLPFRRGKDYMFDQTFHTRPIVQGNASRLPTDVYDYIDANSWLAFLRGQFAVPPPTGDAGLQLARLSADGIRYVIIYKQMLDPSRVAHWQRYFLTKPRYEDERIIIYSTEPQLGRDLFPVTEPVDDLLLTAVFLPTDSYHPGQVVGLGAAWVNRAKLDVRYEVQINLGKGLGNAERTWSFPLTDIGPTELWQSRSIGQGYYPLALANDMSTGRYNVEMQLIQIPQNVSAGEPISAGVINVQTEPCIPPSPTGDNFVNAIFEDQFILRNFEVEQEADQLMVTLNWLALQRPLADYKIFVHLIDSETGLPVAQQDTMPIGWRYPTSLWWAGQEVADPIVIDSSMVESGSYALSVGLYTEDTGERLKIVNNLGEVVPDRSLQLPYVVIINGE